MNDSFKADYDRIGKILSQVRGDLNRRDQKKGEGKLTGIIDAELRGSVNQLDIELTALKKLINEFQANPSKFNLLVREIERRRNLHAVFVNQRNELQKRIENHTILQQQSQLFNETIDHQKFKQQFGEQDNKGLHQIQKQLLIDQDDQIDQINQKVINIKTVGLNINDNIRQQNKHIDSLSDDIDKTTSAMTKTKMKMQNFVHQSSSCGLMMTITFELIVLIMILVLL